MTKPPKDEEPVETPTPPLERIVRLMPELNRSRLEKEMQGLSAKLKWTHINEGLKDVYRARISEIREALKVTT